MNLANLPWWTFALLSAFFAALTTIFAKVGVQNVSSTLATSVRTVVILIMAWAISIGLNEVAELRSLSTRTWVILALSGLATGLSWLCYFRALQLGPAAWVASVDKTSIILILILAALFLNEPLNTRSVLGIGLIAVGTLVLVR